MTHPASINSESTMNSLTYALLAYLIFWFVLAWLAPVLTAVLMIGVGVSLALAAVLPRFLVNPDTEESQDDFRA